MRLLRNKTISQITISELAKEAKVTRVTFYRNYQDMEDILIIRINHLISDWYLENKLEFERDKKDNNRNDLLLSSLFGHLIEFSDFYDVLYQQNLLHLIIPSLKIILSPLPSEKNFSAYLESFFLHGIYGWILEWFHRGKEESADEMESWLRKRIII